MLYKPFHFIKINNNSHSNMAEFIIDHIYSKKFRGEKNDIKSKTPRIVDAKIENRKTYVQKTDVLENPKGGHVDLQRSVTVSRGISKSVTQSAGAELAFKALTLNFNITEENISFIERSEEITVTCSPGYKVWLEYERGSGTMVYLFSDGSEEKKKFNVDFGKVTKKFEKLHSKEPKKPKSESKAKKSLTKCKKCGCDRNDNYRHDQKYICRECGAKWKA